jgi:hypothetical protein
MRRRPVDIEAALLVLGLTKEEVDEESSTGIWEERTKRLHEVVNRARRRVLLECHPDRHAQASEAEQQAALERAQVVNAAAEDLLKLPVRPAHQRTVSPGPTEFVRAGHVVIIVSGTASTSTWTTRVNWRGW